ncbi:hypothetical protein G6011_10490 [Alternaria panax]|uniref:F-box domain-containing protein n=1 Tax=Alternaria panax TaxID=48097 RepID=A0AAD4IBP0_9PLEO|nr:hypothetical protein G6011_10490 [Alternaria panax]
MVGLLDLPSELLFNIMDIVLSSPTVQPKDATRYRPNWWNSSHRHLYCIPNLDLLKSSKVMNLLLVSRRVYIETREYLSKAPRNYEVDIAVVNDHWLWPTRRIVPVHKLDGIIERLDINIIPCCTEEQRSLQTEWDDNIGQDMFDPSGGCFVAEALLAPLLNFLLYPQIDVCLKKHMSNVFRGLEIWVDPPSNAHPTDQSDDDRHLSVTQISTVTISIGTSRYGNGNETLSPAVVPSRKVQGLAHLNFEQLYPVDRAKSEHYLRGLSRYMDKWARAWSTERVEGRIGRIQFYLDEEMWKELDFTSRATDV